MAKGKQSFYAKYVKRILDVFLSLLALIILSPIMIILYILVLVFLGRPGIFKQERLGKEGKIFNIYKYRTMVVGAEFKGDGLKVKSNNDKRIPPFGKILRATSLDELPQLFNVLFGHMSLIGPRPPVTYYPYKYSDYSTQQKKRFKVRPGISGLAQVKVRNSVSWDKRIEYDIEYVKTISFWNDLKICFKTIINVISRDNIYLVASFEDVSLRQIKMSDTPLFYKWKNDEDIFKYLGGGYHPTTKKEARKWVKKISHNNKQFQRFIILYKGQEVGFIGLYNISSEHGTCSLGLYVGEKQFHGKGIATKAYCAIEDYARQLGIRKIKLDVVEDNAAAVHLYKKMKYRLVGTLKQERMIDDGYKNVLIMEKFI